MTKKIILAGIATVVMIVIMRLLSINLVTDYSPNGIVSFELAKSYRDASAIMMAVGVKPLQINVAVDFAFIIAYCFFLYLCCKALLNQYTKQVLKTIGFIFLELSIFIGILDLVENIAMLITLGGYGTKISVSVSKWAAIAKFSIAGLVIVYILIASILLYFSSRKKA
ncbi:MAG TPA: hypothetical protein PKG56_08090 [Chitinophagaceae bacterium]|nr:hypothetical protein [Chitinophagaceae bacterium]MCC6633993.1 hypothetical protein [Chitinophagaceae bacterium]HMZ46982.1 hypothetical protein [Chitinophagaceae bacterium]HNE94035.1 hypothetical protein [Chitinophagaceae bacterium]HNF28657.1 hypothetical protein [Chitinophagaceae bacterium]